MESRCSVQERTRTIRTAPVVAFILGCLGITLRWNLHRTLTVMFYPVMLDEIDKVSSMHRCGEGSHRHSQEVCSPEASSPAHAAQTAQKPEVNDLAHRCRSSSAYDRTSWRLTRLKAANTFSRLCRLRMHHALGAASRWSKAKTRKCLSGYSLVNVHSRCQMRSR